jgi:glucose/mannose-6-phosphate isomerase
MTMAALLTRDPGKVGQALDLLADQLADGWRQASRVKIPATYRQISRVVLCGMGGSHLGSDILRSALADRLKFPIEIVADYRLPAWVDRHTLVMCSSYSGSTEETLEALTVAKKRGAKIVVVTSGGKLAAAAKRLNLPAYCYTPNANPSGQPRLGVAYSLTATLACLMKTGVAKVSPAEVAQLIPVARRAAKRYGMTNPQSLAMRLAKNLNGGLPILIGAEWMVGNLHTWTNQIHENAKSYAAWYLLPDLNHHLLEGLRNRQVTKTIRAVFVADPSLHPRTIRRY